MAKDIVIDGLPSLEKHSTRGNQGCTYNIIAEGRSVVVIPPIESNFRIHTIRHAADVLFRSNGERAPNPLWVGSIEAAGRAEFNFPVKANHITARDVLVEHMLIPIISLHVLNNLFIMKGGELLVTENPNMHSAHTAVGGNVVMTGGLFKVASGNIVAVQGNLFFESPVKFEVEKKDDLIDALRERHIVPNYAERASIIKECERLRNEEGFAVVVINGVEYVLERQNGKSAITVSERTRKSVRVESKSAFLVNGNVVRLPQGEAPIRAEGVFMKNFLKTTAAELIAASNAPLMNEYNCVDRYGLDAVTGNHIVKESVIKLMERARPLAVEEGQALIDACKTKMEKAGRGQLTNSEWNDLLAVLKRIISDREARLGEIKRRHALFTNEMKKLERIKARMAAH